MSEPLHPATGEPLNEIERTLWRFRMAAHEAQVMWRGFNASGAEAAAGASRPCPCGTAVARLAAASDRREASGCSGSLRTLDAVADGS